VERFGDRVVAAMGDHKVHQRDDPGLGKELFSPHIRRQLILAVTRARGHDVAVRGATEDINQALH
jgi:hypothetical protein